MKSWTLVKVPMGNLSAKRIEAEFATQTLNPPNLLFILVPLLGVV